MEELNSWVCCQMWTCSIASWSCFLVASSCLSGPAWVVFHSPRLMRSETLNRLCQDRPDGAQLRPSRRGELSQKPITFRGDGQLHLATITAGTRAPQQTSSLAPVHQLNHAVVIELHALRQRANRRLDASRQAPNG